MNTDWQSYFTFLPLRFTFRAQEDFPVPAYLGAMLRGAFGYAFRREVCLTRKESCEGCILRQDCTYSRIFETPLPSDATVMRKYNSIPRPFVFSPPRGLGRSIHAGDQLDFGLTLFGSACGSLAYIILVLQSVAQHGLGAKRGRCELEQVSLGDTLLFAPNQDLILPAPLSARQYLEHSPCPTGPLHMHFLSPLRLKTAGKINHAPQFRDIYSTLLRRFSLLCTFHCGHSPDIPFKDMLAAAESVHLNSQLSWQAQQRYSTRQHDSMSIGGLLGTASIEQLPPDLWPLLKLGTVLHIGKNATFGLGEYALDTVQRQP